jgi:hypothetical protein
MPAMARVVEAYRQHLGGFARREQRDRGEWERTARRLDRLKRWPFQLLDGIVGQEPIRRATIIGEPDESAHCAHGPMMRDCGGDVLKDRALQSQGSSFVVTTRAAPGIETMRAMLFGHAFSSHRHDTYAIGATALGVQIFRYRGAARHSIGGCAFVIHPDEAHDGRAGDQRGFGYGIAYIEPALILAASHGR